MDLTRLMLACSKAFIVSFVLTPIVRDVFRAYNVVDRPGLRKVHAYPIPRVGGVPIAAAYIVALLSLRGPDSGFPPHWVQTILAGAVVILLTGLIDDFFNLKPAVKLAGQIAAAIAAFASGLSIDQIGNFTLPIWLSLPVTVFWLLLTTNALNLIDGLDGLCAGIGFWASLVFFAVGFLHGFSTLADTALPLAAGLLGFLFFNFNPATVFLGDSGALLIGFLLGCFGIVWAEHRITATTVAIPILALSVPMMDLGLSILRRRLKGQPIFAADRGHVHHRLLYLGLSVRRAAVTLYAAAVAGGVFAILLSYHGSRPVRVIVFTAAAAVAVAGVWKLRYPEFEVAAKLVFKGKFRRVFAEKLRMKQLAQALEHAKSGQDCWLLLIDAAREWNWIRVNWTSQSGTREELLVARKPSWSFIVEIANGESVTVEGDAEAANPCPDMISFSATVSQTLQRRRREWEQPALS